MVLSKSYAKYVVYMGIWIDGLSMEFGQYLYTYIYISTYRNEFNLWLQSLLLRAWSGSNH
jgi:hypothetical protein